MNPKCYKTLDNYTLDEKIAYICKYNFHYFFNKPNVIGVGLGYKIKKGVCTYKKCIKIFVERKIPCNQLCPAELIPSFYNGIETDIVESGPFNLQSLMRKVRPVLGGYSISPIPSQGSGSIGCLVTDGYYKYILSNNHVLADLNNLPINTPIVQPGLDDYGNPSTDIVAVLSKYVPLKFSSLLKKPVNLVDCAIAKVLHPYLASSRIALVGPPKGSIIAKLNDNVRKVGRTTDLTTGQVTSVDTTFSCTVEDKKLYFTQQISTTRMSKFGDSGSVLLNKDNYVMGMLLGSCSSYSVFNSISNVLKELKVSIVTD